MPISRDQVKSLISEEYSNSNPRGVNALLEHPDVQDLIDAAWDDLRSTILGCAEEISSHASFDVYAIQADDSQAVW
jgi:hypothetical protein